MRKSLLVLLLSVATMATAQQRSITLADYIAALERIEAQLGAKQFTSVTLEATQLKGVDVTWSGGRIRTDGSLLDELTNAPQQSGVRLRSTIVELRATGAANAPPANPKLLQQVAAEQDVPELAPGGEVATKLAADVPYLERIAEGIEKIWAWLTEKLTKLLEWIFDLFPRRKGIDGSGTAGLSWIVVAIVIAILVFILLLAVHVIRRSRRAAPAVETSEPLGSKRDEDPLSRGASEWEKYAAQLAAAGRYREAIRAWYHAVLVTCYAAGVLHFRKGRTNWEYVATLPPSLAWRPEMITLTRRFEREWYGAEESTQEALEDCSGRAQAILDAVRMRGAA